ncbi:MAG: bifunctional ornithine acetyltransferase/N-acetylglutamate synthase, partial [Clostridia bacterium]|nr:bifunctional ornithine acetyltransferase/N-acetylglutamate synthase [Clostridia bacterium]
MVEFIEGGVCAPKGFKANGIHCGIRKNASKRDLALIISEKRCSAAAVYTTNLVKGAPVVVTKEHLQDGYAQAIIVNSGNANTCNRNGVSIANRMCALVKRYTKIPKEDVVIGSTGVIGQKLTIDPVKEGMPALAQGLGNNSWAAAEAIMTTDTVKKECAVKFTLSGKEVRMGAIGKGVGMICPNMATLLLFVTTDAAISPRMLQKALSEEVEDSLNMLSVDRDTSTNDTFAVLA